MEKDVCFSSESSGISKSETPSSDFPETGNFKRHRLIIVEIDDVTTKGWLFKLF